MYIYIPHYNTLYYTLRYYTGLYSIMKLYTIICYNLLSYTYSIIKGPAALAARDGAAHGRARGARAEPAQGEGPLRGP